MKAGIGLRTSVAAILCLAAAGTASAKGYSASRQATTTAQRELEQRITGLEDRQKKLEEVVMTELGRIRAELNHAQAQHVAKTSANSLK